MAASPELFKMLAEAIGQPSKAYRAAEAGLSIPLAGMEGYETGAQFGDAIRRRQLMRQTLGQVLGASAPTDTENIPIEQADMLVKPVMAYAMLQRAEKTGMPKSTLSPWRVIPGMRTKDNQPVELNQLTGETRPVGIETAPPEVSKQFIGNDADGTPLLIDKQGNITRGTTPSRGPVLPKTSTMPTSMTRGSGEFAAALLPHVQDMRNLIQEADAKGYIGPGAGRIYGQFLAGGVGSTGDPQADALLGKLRTTDSLIKSGMLRTHFGARGGQQMYEHFSKMLNSGNQSAAMMGGSLDAMESFLKGYATAGGARIPSSGTQIDPQDQAAMDWLNQNPDDPRAAAVSGKLKAKGVLQ